MKSVQRLRLLNPFFQAVLATAAATVCLSAQAQVTTSPNGGMSPSPGSGYNRDAYSLLPFTRRGYVGLNLGRTQFDTACGAGGYGCEKSSLAGYLYTGGLFNEWLGVELGYLNTGKADRSGGATRAQGVNLQAVLRAPLGAFNLFAKGGAIYGQTRVSTGLLSDVASGSRRSWGPAYGAGVGFDFTPTSGLVLEWTRNELRFPGSDGRQDLETTSLGYVARF